MQTAVYVGIIFTDILNEERGVLPRTLKLTIYNYRATLVHLDLPGNIVTHIYETQLPGIICGLAFAQLRYH